VYRAEVYVDDEKVAEAEGTIQEGGQEKGGEESLVSDHKLVPDVALTRMVTTLRVISYQRFRSC